MNLLPMKLVMYLGLDCIDAIALNTKRISQPGYLGSLKRELMEKYASELQFLSEEPEFLIAGADDRREQKNASSSALLTRKQPILQAVAE